MDTIQTTKAWVLELVFSEPFFSRWSLRSIFSFQQTFCRHLRRHYLLSPIPLPLLLRLFHESTRSFFNVMTITLPLALFGFYRYGSIKGIIPAIFCQLLGSFLLYFFPLSDPAANVSLNFQRAEAIKKNPHTDWYFDLKYMTPYEKLNTLLHYRKLLRQHRSIQSALFHTLSPSSPLLSAPPTLWFIQQQRQQRDIERETAVLSDSNISKDSNSYQSAQTALNKIVQRQAWLDTGISKLSLVISPP